MWSICRQSLGDSIERGARNFFVEARGGNATLQESVWRMKNQLNSDGIGPGNRVDKDVFEGLIAFNRWKKGPV